MYCHGRFWVLHVAFWKWHSPGRVVHNWVIAPQRHARQTLPAKPLFPYAWAIPSAALFQQLWNDPTRFSDRSANHSQHRACSNGWSSWALWETPSSRDRKPTEADSSSSRNAILSPFPVIFLKNIETFLVFCARCLLFQPLWWIWMWIVRADSSFFFSVECVTGVLLWSGGGRWISPWKQAPHVQDDEETAAFGCSAGTPRFCALREPTGGHHCLETFSTGTPLWRLTCSWSQNMSTGRKRWI